MEQIHSDLFQLCLECREAQTIKEFNLCSGPILCTQGAKNMDKTFGDEETFFLTVCNCDCVCYLR